MMYLILVHRRGRQMNQKFKFIFSYIVTSRPAWATRDLSQANK